MTWLVLTQCSRYFKIRRESCWVGAKISRDQLAFLRQNYDRSPHSLKWWKISKGTSAADGPMGGYGWDVHVFVSECIWCHICWSFKPDLGQKQSWWLVCCMTPSTYITLRGAWGLCCQIYPKSSMHVVSAAPIFSTGNAEQYQHRIGWPLFWWQGTIFVQKTGAWISKVLAASSLDW